MGLNWSIDTSILKDGESYLIKMKQGALQGQWRDKDKVFIIYLCRDVEFSGMCWVPMKEIE